jgi:curved DNA-binding protein CbpA
MASGVVDYYGLLRIPRDASPDEIKKSYLALGAWPPCLQQRGSDT